MTDNNGLRILNIDISREKRSIEVEVISSDRIIDILRRVDLPVDGVLVFMEDRPIPLDTALGDIENIKVINVASGG